MRTEPLSRHFRLLVLALVLGACGPSDTTAVSAVASRTQSIGPLNTYFGDLHGHTAYSGDGCDQAGNSVPGTAALLHTYYTHARDTEGLDFVAINDHASSLSQAELDTMSAVAGMYNAPGSFVPFLGYEWTSSTYGHRTVVFKQLGSGMPLYSASAWAPNGIANIEDLWTQYTADGFSGRVFTLPHHPAAVIPAMVDWSHHDATYQPLVEIYSEHGSSETCTVPNKVTNGCSAANTVRTMLASGLKLGIYAGTDSHDTSPGSVGDADACLPHPYNGGLMAVLAPNLTRNALWNAMTRRRIYGTTGPRIQLWFTVDGQPMGSEISGATAPQIVVLAVGDGAAISQIQVIKDNATVHTCTSSPCTYTDSAFTAAAVYRVRAIQTGGDMAWSSPIWVAP